MLIVCFFLKKNINTNKKFFRVFIRSVGYKDSKIGISCTNVKVQEFYLQLDFATCEIWSHVIAGGVAWECTFMILTSVVFLPIL